MADEEVVSSPSPIPPAGSRGRWIILALIGVVVVLGGAAAAVTFFALKGTGDVIGRMIPSSANVYVTAYLDPAASQKVNLLRLSQKFPPLQDADAVDRQINDALDAGLAGLRLKSADVRPWLGSQVAFAGKIGTDSAPSVAFLLATNDDAAARAALEKARHGVEGTGSSFTERSYRGETIVVGSVEGEALAYLVLNHVVVVSNAVNLVQDIIDTDQGKTANLIASDSFVQTMGGLPKERLGMAFLDPAPLVQQITVAALATGAEQAEIQAGLAQLNALRGIGLSFSAEPNGVSLNARMAVDRSKLPSPLVVPSASRPPSLLPYLPRKSIAVLASTGLPVSAASLRQQLESTPFASDLEELDRSLGLFDAIGHLTGSVGIEVGPGSNSPLPAGAVVLGVDNEKAISSFLERLSAEFATPSAVTDIGEIVTPRIPELDALGIEPSYAVVDGVAIIGTSPAEVTAVLDGKASGSSITANPTFQQVVGPGASFTQMLYLDVQGLASAFRTALPPRDRLEFDSQAGPILRPMKAFVQTSDSDAEGVSIRLFLLVP